MTPDAEVAAWREWRRLCAFGLLGESEGAALRDRVGERFRTRLRQVGLVDSNPSNEECAHGFETWCALHERRDGKKYKEWLLTRGRRDLDTIQSGVMLLIRDVAREWIRLGCADRVELSLDQPIASAGGHSLAELLPDEVSGPGEEEAAWVRGRTEVLVADASPVEAAVLRVRAEGRVFSCAAVRADTGFGKTALHQHHRRLLESLAHEVRERFPDVEAGEASAMVLEVLDGAGERIKLKFFAENRPSATFGSTEPKPEDDQ